MRRAATAYTVALPGHRPISPSDEAFVMTPARICGLLAACLSVGAALPAQDGTARPASARPWEHESSDLPVDPAIHFGHFDNGLRWAWARNVEPRQRSYLRLHVNAGSLAEEDSERGLAHFLEHMAFNGSEHFAAGTLVEWFQRHGMAFGADLNAETGFGQTVYKLDLPNSDEKTLDEGLLVLRDFASGLTLAPHEIEAEKGVIDGEERERDSAGYRVFVRQLQTLFGSTRLDERIPIGLRETRAGFDEPRVRAFYARWYRPENMTLVLVGDLGELDPVPLFARHFAALPRPAEALHAEPGVGPLGAYPARACFHEPEIPGVTLLVQRARPWQDEPYGVAKWRADLPLSAARQMLNLRFREEAKQATAPFLSVRASSAEALDALDGESLAISCRPERWREALAAGEQGLRRALEHGFQAAELGEVRANALRALDEALEREHSRASSALVGEILTAAEDRYVPTSAATDRALLKPLYEALTPEACQRALVEAWSRGEFGLYTVGNLDLGAEAARTLDEAWEASRATPVEKPAEITATGFAYAAGEEAGALAARETVADLDFVSLRFANGVALALKRTDFKEKQILVTALLGEGRLSLAPADAALAFVAERTFAEGGLGAHSVDDIRRLTAGKQVGLRFGVGVDAFSLSGATTREDLLFELELLCAYLQAPGWREDGLVQMRRGLPLLYEGLAHQHQGPVLTRFMDELLGGDARFVFPPQPAVESLSIDSLRAWLAPMLADAPLEVTMVGDLDLEATVAAAARTLGRLPPRRALREYAENRKAPSWKTGVSQEHTIETEVQKALVLLAFPVPDGIEVERHRQLEFLGEVVRDRLRLEVRERLGAAYSPGANVQGSRTYPGFGMLMLQAMAEPDKTDALKQAFLSVTDALAEKGVTQEEVERLREPLLKGLRDAQRQNGYWLSGLSELQRRPASLDELRGRQASLEKMDAAALSALAKAHLTRARVASIVVHPEPTPPATQVTRADEDPGLLPAHHTQAPSHSEEGSGAAERVNRSRAGVSSMQMDCDAAGMLYLKKTRRPLSFERGSLSREKADGAFSWFAANSPELRDATQRILTALGRLSILEAVCSDSKRRRIVAILEDFSGEELHENLKAVASVLPKECSDAALALKMAELVASLEASPPSHGWRIPHSAVGGKDLEARVTFLRMSTRGTSVLPSEAMCRFLRLYHDANSFHERPDYEPATLKATPSFDRLRYSQSIDADYDYDWVFDTWEACPGEIAPFECVYWPQSSSPKKVARGVDSAFLFPNADGSIEYLAFVSVFQNEDKNTRGSTGDQHANFFRANAALPHSKQ